MSQAPVVRRARGLSRPRLVGGAIFAIVVILAATPTYLALAPTWRTLAVRLVCATAAIAGCIRAVRWARDAVAAERISPLDAAEPQPPGPELDPRFLALREDVIESARSRRYFDVVLWPRLVELAGTQLRRPASRWSVLRRGPSMRELSRLVGEIERNP
jgi:hypothetical protein